MNIPIYQIDAFTGKLFSGNPAAVCPLQQWIDERTMQLIARENNLSETAFFVPEGGNYRIRWFTPVEEVDLCGHATQASAFVIFNELDPKSSKIIFESRSGQLVVERSGDMLAMDFPSQQPVQCTPPEELIKGLGAGPSAVLKSADYFVVYDKKDDILALKPDMDLLKKVDLRGVIVTAPGTSSDFVSRFFAPRLGIDEDPVTGSAHCALIPYWAGRLGKKDLHSLQVSERGGELYCKDKGDRVIISGRAVKYMQGNITIG
ncbi:MAG TPA: PhzF family phenazine biosynthesis protein [Desulfomonilia bacterium]|nr:PhzF family phenazine biosynthesis protein [Desulfomonilia bacterium]